MFEKFYKKPLDQRRQVIKDYFGSKGQAPTVLPELPETVADRMVENYVYNHHLPLGLGLNFTINNKEYKIPMAVEEPSVIAAASNGAKILGNIDAEMPEKVLVGQMIFSGVEVESAQECIENCQEEWLNIARMASSQMVDLGGGPQRIWGQAYNNDDASYYCFYLAFDPVDAMGANTLNTVLETLAPRIQADCGGELIASILSNYCPDSIASARVEVALSRLHHDPSQALRMAQRISQLAEYAHLDSYRAVTHNKGIMNGVDALLIATGNDWRAFEAGVHAYASRHGNYEALSSWYLNQDQTALIGELALPIQIATVGGTLGTHPQAQWAIDMLGRPTALELGEVAVSLGLAQNFAALRALVTDGIQKGHMALHARSLLAQWGADNDQLEQLMTLIREKELYEVNQIRSLWEQNNK